jgi:hypothetical protein
MPISTGKDIHKITAMAVSGHTEETWAQLTKDEQKLLEIQSESCKLRILLRHGTKESSNGMLRLITKLILPK